MCIDIPGPGLELVLSANRVASIASFRGCADMVSHPIAGSVNTFVQARTIGLQGVQRFPRCHGLCSQRAPLTHATSGVEHCEL